MHVSPHLRAINLQRSMIFDVIVMNYENTHMKSMCMCVCECNNENNIDDINRNFYIVQVQVLVSIRVF